MAHMVAKNENGVYSLIIGRDDTESKNVMKIANCCKQWSYFVGPATRYIRDLIAGYLERLSEEDILYAIRETASAPRPSVRYFDAICKRLAAGGSRNRPKKAPPLSRFDYEQRNYTEEELMDLLEIQ